MQGRGAVWLQVAGRQYLPVRVESQQSPITDASQDWEYDHRRPDRRSTPKTRDPFPLRFPLLAVGPVKGWLRVECAGKAVALE